MGKIKRKKDPHAAREAAKYENPVPSREYILEHIKAKNIPFSLLQICNDFGLEDADQIEGIRRRLKAMLRDGQLEQLSRRRYWLVGQHNLVTGTVSIDKKNMLWVMPEDRSARILLPHYIDNKVMQGTKVIVSVPNYVTDEPREGKIVEVLSQPDYVVTGRYVNENGLHFVVPFSKEFLNDIVISPGDSLGAVNGQIVVVEISAQHSSRADPVGKIVEILGDERNKNVEIEASLRKHRIPYQWPEDVLREVKSYKDYVVANEAESRVDLRALPLVTIDGEDARDFDDAVFAMPKHAGGWQLYVAIADVSHYVKDGSALDIEALNRGNSVYFPTRVVPMLPEILSNGLCSLKPDEDRLCMVCEMSIDKSGKMNSYKFYPAIMRSKARMTYTKIAKILDGDEILNTQYASLVPHFKDLANLYNVLREARTKRGAIDFETIETTISFGKNGTISSINPVERNVAHKIIEECMLCANVATAEFLAKYKVPSLYRNHEGPPIDKLTDLKTFLREIGLSIGKGKDKDPQPIDYSTLLEKIKDRPDYRMVQTVLLRSLSQAVYAPDNLGHFGLAYKAYTHFTSPIRRYPDLVIHRQIKAVLAGLEDAKKAQEDPKLVAKFQEELQAIANHCSNTERRADDATRDVILSLKCQYIKQHVGQVFAGVISGVTRFGLFVELTDYYIDGLVHIASIDDDYYIFDPIHHKLTGERSGVIYHLGMPVKVQVAKVNTDELKIDFNLIQGRRAQNKAGKKIAMRDEKRNKTRKNKRGPSASVETDFKKTKSRKRKSKRK